MAKPYDRPAYGNPGGCECMKCGVIFVGAEHHEFCAVCIQGIADKIADEQNLDTSRPMADLTEEET
jgi:hypothetical protein